MDLPLNISAIPKGRFALAFSGGGDSTALLHALRGKEPYVLIVDHGLRRGSADEARAAAAFAGSLGLTSEVLRWSPPKGLSSVQAKARIARYEMMGRRCRALGLSALLTGHTLDDQAETVLMRVEAGGSWRGAAAMRAVTISPLWPQLWGITVYRPMLKITRAAVRQYLSAQALPYTDDPSNQNRDFSRVRARGALLNNAQLRQEMIDLGADIRCGRRAERARFASVIKRGVSADEFGCLYIQTPVAPYLLGRLLRAASGANTTASTAPLKSLRAAMAAPDFKGATLGGALVMPRERASGAGGFVISRDPVMAFGRKGQAPLAARAPAQEDMMWDGRFALNHIAGREPNMSVSVAAGRLGALSPVLKRGLKACPVQARPTLPLFLKGSDITGIGPLTSLHDGSVLAQSMVMARLLGEFKA